MARYKDYDSLPEHIKGMLRAVTSGEDGAAERYAEVPNKNLKGLSVMQLINTPFGQRTVEKFLYELGEYLAVETDMEVFRPHFGKKK